MRTTSHGCPSVRWALIALAAALGARAAIAQPAYQVSPTPRFPGYPSTQLVDMNGELFFPANAGGNAWGLWKSDGTTAGTVLVKAGVRPTSMTIVNLGGVDRLFFADSAGGPSGVELWISDGTDPGTVLLKDIFPGASSSSPQELKAVNFTVLGNRLLFSATNGVNGRELWVSDGTAVGTVMLKDLLTGAQPGNPSRFVEAGGTVFFAAGCTGCINSTVLWKTDGTTAGTVVVLDVFVYGEIANIGSTVLFVAATTATGVELWRSDGTGAGTVLVKDIYVGGGSSRPRYLTPVGSAIYFAAYDPVNGDELWTSDGTDPGTAMVGPLVPGVNPLYSGPQQLRNVNARLYFMLDDGVHGTELWTATGTSGNLVKDINPGPGSSLGIANNNNTLTRPGLVAWDCWSAPTQVLSDSCTIMRHANGVDYFFADDGTSGSELWQTDGTSLGTVPVADTYPGPDDFYVALTATKVVGGRLFMGARGPDVPSTDYATRHLWALPLTPSIVPGNVSVVEGNAGTANAVMTVMVYPPPIAPISVNFATADGTTNPATAGIDYTAASGTLTFGPGSSTQTVTVAVNGETLPEANETFLLNLSGASGAPIADDQSIGTILNDDGPGISVADIPSQLENGIAIFFVTLSASSSDTITVDYATADGSAVAGSDYTATSGTLTFTPGQTQQTVLVNITTDALDEPDENFFLNLTNPIFGSMADGQGEAIIIDDDATPNMTINNVTVTEPNAPATQNMSFTISLSAASGQAITVDYATTDGTATGGLDYVPLSGTLTIPAGTGSTTLVVTVIGDNIDEPNETLFMNLGNAANANITDGQGQGNITDNDTTSITINNRTLPENVGSFDFTVTLSVPYFQDVTLNYATANGTATAPGDYAATSGTLTVLSGATTAGIFVPIVDDNLDEPVTAETFFVNLSGSSGPAITDAQGQGNITDNDTSSIQITDVSLPEGNTGTTTPFVFDLTLSTPSVNQITLHYATANGTATAGSDYVAASGNLTFAAGETTTTPVSVVVNGDNTSEPNETFRVNLSAITGTVATTAGPATGTILNDDTPGFAINDVTVTEGNTGTLNATFTVSLLGTFTGTPSVDFATADGTALAAIDYTTATGTLTFTTGVSTRTLVVPIIGDTLDELNETYTVNLSNPVGGPVITDGQGTGTITDNDTSGIAVNNVTVTEGNSGTINLTFNVTLTVPSSQGVNVDYATADVTAVAPGDYLSASGTLTFPVCQAQTPPCPPDATLQTVTVAIVGDALDEANETFQLNLTNPVNATITDAQGIGTITDNDTSTLAIADTSALEGDTGTTPMAFTVTLGGGKSNLVTVNYATGTTGTATSGVDYTAAAGTLTFPACTAEPCPPGSLSQNLNVDLIGDTNIEPNETFFVNLSVASGATVSDPQSQGTILNDDGTPSLSISDVDIVEPATLTATAAFTVTLLPPSTGVINVNFATANGSATAPGDYTTASGLLSFAAGNTSRTVNVTVRSDATPEPPETFSVNLSNPTGGGVIADGTGTGTIVDRLFSLDELDHGSRVVTDLLPPAPTLRDEDRYRIRQAPRSSYEVVVDAQSGDAVPVELDLLASDNSTSVASGTPATGGGAMSLRFRNDTAAAITNQRVRVRAGGGACGTNCDAQDLYRIRAWDTTYRVARYNNSSTQITILVLQNPTDATLNGTVWFWNAATGALNGSATFTIPAKGVFSLNTSTVAGVAGTSGGLTITNDAPYGVLVGKAVAVETATGFTFDTALEARAR